MRINRPIGITTIFTALLVLLAATAAPAATIIVDSLADDGSGGCTLREAIESANGNVAVGGCTAGTAGADQVILTVTGTIHLTGSISVSEDVAIGPVTVGPGSASYGAPNKVTITSTGIQIFYFNSPGDNGFFTLTHVNLAGSGADFSGGIYVWPGDKLTMYGCRLTGFRQSSGAAIYNNGGRLDIFNSVISGNTATSTTGGGIYTSGPLIMLNSLVSGNTSLQNGAGIHADGAAVTIEESTFSGNRAGGRGGAIYTETVAATIVNCILWGDQVEGAPADESREVAFDGGAPTIVYSDVAGGYPYPSSNPWPGTGNILAAPRFIGARAASAAPTAAGNYHLRADSPCVNQGTTIGTNTYDIDGDVRVQDAGEDMGVDEAGPPYNDSFEYGLAIPAPWKGRNLTALDKRSKGGVRGSAWSFTMTGSTANKSLWQSLPISGGLNDTIILAGWSKAYGASATGGPYRLEAKVFYDDQTTELLTANFAKKTHGWKFSHDALTAKGPYSRIVVTARYSGQKGAASFDSIKVYRQEP